MRLWRVGDKILDFDGYWSVVARCGTYTDGDGDTVTTFDAMNHRGQRRYIQVFTNRAGFQF